MEQIKMELFNFLEVACEQSRKGLKLVQERDFDNLNAVLDEREKVINIISHLHEKLSLHQRNLAPEEVKKDNNQVYRLINQINQYDEIITSCLEHEKNKTQFEIAKTFKNKEHFKGYNLKSTKL